MRFIYYADGPGGGSSRRSRSRDFNTIGINPETFIQSCCAVRCGAWFSPPPLVEEAERDQNMAPVLTRLSPLFVAVLVTFGARS